MCRGIVLPKQIDVYDKGLSKALCTILRGKFIGDFGAGYGHYTDALNQVGVCWGYDYDPGGPTVRQFDLSIPLILPVFDWVISLEVLEHIPKQYEDIAIENICRHSGEGVVISWAKKGQGGVGHVNEKSRKWVRHAFQNRGYKYNERLTLLVRKAATVWWFKENLLVLER